MPLHDAPLNFEGLCNHLDDHVIFHVMVCNNSCNYMNIPSCYIIYYTHHYTHHYIILHAILHELLQRQLHVFLQDITCYLPSNYMNSQQNITCMITWHNTAGYMYGYMNFTWTLYSNYMTCYTACYMGDYMI